MQKKMKRILFRETPDQRTKKINLIELNVFRCTICVMSGRIMSKPYMIQFIKRIGKHILHVHWAH